MSEFSLYADGTLEQIEALYEPRYFSHPAAVINKVTKAVTFFHLPFFASHCQESVQGHIGLDQSQNICYCVPANKSSKYKSYNIMK